MKKGLFVNSISFILLQILLNIFNHSFSFNNSRIELAFFFINGFSGKPLQENSNDNDDVLLLTSLFNMDSCIILIFFKLNPFLQAIKNSSLIPSNFPLMRR